MSVKSVVSSKSGLGIFKATKSIGCPSSAKSTICEALPTPSTRGPMITDGGQSKGQLKASRVSPLEVR